MMSGYPSPTDAQKAAAKPWLIVLLAAVSAGTISYGGLCYYMARTANFDQGLVAFWIGATWVGVRAIELACQQKLESIAPDAATPHKRSWLRSLVVPILLVALFLLLRLR